MKAKYKVGDRVYCLVDIGVVLKNRTYIPVRHTVVDRFTGNDEQIYYSLKNDDEVMPFTDLEFDEIHESKLFDTKKEAEKFLVEEIK